MLGSNFTFLNASIQLVSTLAPPASSSKLVTSSNPASILDSFPALLPALFIDLAIAFAKKSVPVKAFINTFIYDTALIAKLAIVCNKGANILPNPIHADCILLEVSVSCARYAELARDSILYTDCIPNKDKVNLLALFNDSFIPSFILLKEELNILLLLFILLYCPSSFSNSAFISKISCLGNSLGLSFAICKVAFILLILLSNNSLSAFIPLKALLPTSTDIFSLILLATF